MAVPFMPYITSLATALNYPCEDTAWYTYHCLVHVSLLVHI